MPAAGPTVVTKKPRPVAADSGIRSIYGFDVPVNTPMLALELKCYRENVTREQGGLGAEQHFKNAWKIMWPEYQWNDWVEMMVHAWCNYRYISIIGHQRAGKTYNSAHIAYLDYCANPFETLSNFITVTFEGLRIRMWSDLMKAVETGRAKQAFTIRNTSNELRVFPEQVGRESGEKYQIRGMAVDKNKDAPGKIKGAHAPRVRLFIDEAENVSDIIYEAMDNPMSAPDSKAMMLFNPLMWNSPAGRLTIPKAGLSSISANDLFWETKRGICLHFDGLQSPNLTQNKVVFPGILTRENVDEARINLTENSVAWWSRIRGFPPPDGMVSQIFPSQIIEKAKPEIVFDYATEPCFTLDPAFGGDNCVAIFGRKGRLRDGRMAITAIGSEVITFSVGENAALIDHQITSRVLALCKVQGVKPSNFIMDRSGPGRGIYAALYKEWSPEIHGVDYGGSATDRPVRSDEKELASEIYEKFVTELWHRAKESIADGILGGLSKVDERVVDELSSRLYETKEVTRGTVIVAETKTEMKKRLGRSPDFADAYVQFAELLIREGYGPGRLKAGQRTGSKWSRQLKRAVQANQRFAEEKEYSFH